MKKLISILLAALMVAALIVPVNAEFEVPIENEAAAYIVDKIWTNYDFTEKEGSGRLWHQQHKVRAARPREKGRGGNNG